METITFLSKQHNITWIRVDVIILIPFWLIIMWDCTAPKMHLTQAMYVICTWDWQQNLTYVWYVAPSAQKSTLTCRYAPPTIYWLKGTGGLTFVYKLNILALVTGVIASAFLEVKLHPLIDYFNWYCFVVPGNHKLHPLIDYLSRQWHGEKWKVYYILIRFHLQNSERYEKNIIICFKNETRLSQHTWLWSIHISLVSLRSLVRYFWSK